MDRPKLAIFQQPSKQQPSKDSSKESIEGKAGHRRKKMKKTRQGTDGKKYIHRISSIYVVFYVNYEKFYVICCIL